jgi:hypothetical protein
VISTAVFSKDSVMITTTVKFFLNNKEEDDDKSDSDEVSENTSHTHIHFLSFHFCLVLNKDCEVIPFVLFLVLRTLISIKLKYTENMAHFIQKKPKRKRRNCAKHSQNINNKREKKSKINSMKKRVTTLLQ